MPEKLRPISVPLVETELFTQPDYSGGLTPEGSIFQRYIHFNHALSREVMGNEKRKEYEEVAKQDASSLGISDHSAENLTGQWMAMVEGRDNRIRQQFLPTKTEPVPVFDSAVAGS